MPKPPHATPHAVARFEPRNASQRLAQRLYHQSDVLFLTGPAGCGKTLCSVGMAAVDVLSGGPRNKIVVLRPAVVAGERLGFLTGDLGEKIAPFMTPVKQALAKTTFHFPPERVSYEAVGYSRGVSWDNCVIVLDEAQNSAWPELLLVLTRLGKDSKLLITGDPDQSDIRGTSKTHHCDLDEVIDRLEGEPGIGIVDFPDGESLRNPLIGKLLRRLTPR